MSVPRPGSGTGLLDGNWSLPDLDYAIAIGEDIWNGVSDTWNDLFGDDEEEQPEVAVDSPDATERDPGEILMGNDDSIPDIVIDATKIDLCANSFTFWESDAEFHYYDEWHGC